MHDKLADITSDVLECFIDKARFIDHFDTAYHMVGNDCKHRFVECIFRN